MAYLSGLITIVESVFNYPGIGYLLLNSIRSRDFIVVQGVVLFMVFLVIIVNLIVDILYTDRGPAPAYRPGHRCVRPQRPALDHRLFVAGSLHFGRFGRRGDLTL
jgi:hypothetical protein